MTAHTARSVGVFAVFPELLGADDSEDPSAFAASPDEKKRLLLIFIMMVLKKADQ